MVVHFYLLAASFSNNAVFSREEIEKKFKRFYEDVTLINKYKDTNKLYLNINEIYPKILYSTYPIEDFVCRKPEVEGLLDRDVRNALSNLIDKAEKTDISLERVRDEFLPIGNQDLCYALIAFHEVEEFSEKSQIIYGKDDWYRFRRDLLGLYPRNGEFFINECKKYFPNLFFHENNQTSVEKILHDSAKKIIYHLSALNDKFRDSQMPGRNRAEVLRCFSISASLDENATLEGDATRKRNFTFSFATDDGKREDVCCEPHCKLCHNDNNSAYSTNRRIYFHEGKANISDGKILIGHIGVHL